MILNPGRSFFRIQKDKRIFTFYLKSYFVFAFFLLIMSAFGAIAQAKTFHPDSSGPNHTLFTQVLRDHVQNGAVDYKAIKQDRRFAEYIEILEKTNPDAIAQRDRLAFWINAYNAFMIKRVVDLYPIESIMSKFMYFFKMSNFHEEFIQMNGQEYSLNDIEHNIIRPYGDARIHFALVCAAKSCPTLRSEAYESDRLEEQLDDQGRLFLQDTTKNNFDFQQKKAEISAIFDWFKEDFEKNAPTVFDFISRYLPQDQATAFKANIHVFKIEYKNYDWKLNDATL